MFQLAIGLSALTILAHVIHRIVVAPRAATLEAAGPCAAGREPRGRGALEVARRGAIALLALGILGVGLAQRGQSEPVQASTPEATALALLVR